MIETLDHFDPHSFTALNQEFHAILFEQCANPRLLEIVNAANGAGSGTCATRPSASSPAARRSPCASTRTSCRLIEAGAPLGEIEKAARRHRSATLDAYLIHEHPDEALGLPDSLTHLRGIP